MAKSAAEHVKEAKQQIEKPNKALRSWLLQPKGTRF
jgi:hypothetical protein